MNFPCSADHEQDWQPYPVDPYSNTCDDHPYIHILNKENIPNSRNIPYQHAFDANEITCSETKTKLF